MELGHTLKCIALGMPAMFMGGKPGCRAGSERLSYMKLEAPDLITVASDAFDPNSDIPAMYSQDGYNTSPPLHWTGVPAETHSIALIVEDPDAPTPNPYVHWLAYNIFPETTRLPEGIINLEYIEAPLIMMQGKNSSLKPGFIGAAPPRGDSPHHYHFQLFALDIVLPILPGVGRGALLDAMKGHVLGKGELIGLFQR